MELSGALVPPFVLVASAFAGRVALSLLPAGSVGAHRLTELPATWATSHVLGWILLTVEERVLAACGLSSSAIVLLAPWALLATLRIATLPGALVPRHEPARERSSVAVRALLLASALLVAAAALRRGADAGTGRIAAALAEVLSAAPDALARASTWIVAANAVALLALVTHGLAIARRAPFGRAVLVAGLAAIVALRSDAVGEPDRSLHELCIGAGAAFGIGALRRADRRAAVLCAICASGSALFFPSAWPLATLSLALFVLRAPAPMRARVARLAAIGAVVAGIAGRPFAWRVASELAPARASMLAAGALLAASSIALVWTLRSARAGEHESGGAPIDAPSIELAYLRDLVLAGLAVLALQSAFAARALAVALVPLLSVCALMIGLVLIRNERPVDHRAGERA
ncbi:MAG: hypothetical protein ACKVWV_04535 [Planctomycetota bacterium]